MINETIEKYMTERNETGLPDKFIVTGNLKHTSSGKPSKGQTYVITAGAKDALKATNVADEKDWFIVTTPILKVAFSDGIVKALK